jgi:hypothetical protein
MLHATNKLKRATKKQREGWRLGAPVARLVAFQVIGERIPHWLALAVMGVFFTRKSHAAHLVIGNSLIGIDKTCVGDIFDSHHPLQPQPSLANASQLVLLPRNRKGRRQHWP